MIRVNLLPFRAARKRENIRRQISVFLLSIILTGVVIAYYHINLSRRIETLTKTVEETKKEVKKYNAINKRIAHYKKQLSTLNKQLQVIKGLEANRLEPVRLLDTMTDVVVPKRMWFTNFKTSGRKVTIKGVAIDNQTVADFMTRLEKTRLFSNVSLKSVQHKKIRGTDLKSFEVNINKRAPKKPTPKKKSKKKKA